jgi:YbgC/YbaW family acyl-CoA thioester hydrolase
MAFEFKQTRRVEFADTDMGGIVHFSNYYRYMEAAEHAFYRSLGLRIHAPGDESGIGWPRVATSCTYKGPLRFGDEVEIHLLVREKRTKTLTYALVLSKVEGGQRTEVARGAMTVISAVLDPVSGTIKAIPIPPEFDARIEAAPPGLLPAADDRP